LVENSPLLEATKSIRDVTTMPRIRLNYSYMPNSIDLPPHKWRSDIKLVENRPLLEATKSIRDVTTMPRIRLNYSYMPNGIDLPPPKWRSDINW